MSRKFLGLTEPPGQDKMHPFHPSFYGPVPPASIQHFNTPV